MPPPLLVGVLGLVLAAASHHMQLSHAVLSNTRVHVDTLRVVDCSSLPCRAPPDLSPIENLWGVIAGKVNAAGCTTFDEFRRELQ